MLGVAYKADIGDMRESPALKLIELLRTRGRRASPTTTRTCPSCPSSGSRSSPLEPAALRLRRDRHRALGDRLRASSSSDAQLVVDLRNATGGHGARATKVWKL